MTSSRPSSTSAKEKAKPSSDSRLLTPSEVNWLRQHNKQAGEQLRGRFSHLKTPKTNG
jgi:hypothetical protein